MTAGVENHFTGWDWAVIATHLVLTTFMGHRLRGRQATVRDFFLAGRSLPWPAVCASIIATEISALTFIGVPGMVFAAGGDFRYLQWALGSVLARLLVGLFLVRVYYEREIYSPYDYMANRLGPAVRTLSSLLFGLGSVLGQSVRLLVTALVLQTVTPLDMTQSIVAITLFAIAWTLMGGMTTVIWTDAIQFLLFVGSGLLAFGWLIVHLDGGWAAYLATGTAHGKFRLIDLSTDPGAQFTLWVALLAMPFQNLAAFGTDQLNAQRIFCCRSPGDARKAIVWSSASQAVTVLMLAVGAALYVHYQQHPPSGPVAALFARDPDHVFPVWITTELPPGLTGFVLAGAFAAAISSLDSALCALAQTSLGVLHAHRPTPDPGRLIRQSRVAVVLWGLVLAGLAVGLNVVKTQGGIDLVSLAFGMVAYTYGPLLALLLLSLLGRSVDRRSLTLGIGLSLLLAAWVRPDLGLLLKSAGSPVGQLLLDARPGFSFVWLYPLTCLLTLVCGLLGSRPARTAP